LFDIVFFLPETISILLQLKITFLPTFFGQDAAIGVCGEIVFYFLKQTPCLFQINNWQWASNSGWEESPVMGAMLRLRDGRRKRRKTLDSDHASMIL
jgi:hypothetical protein